jgi:alpha-beta hydrolase superfamily lysophospholipase
VADHRGHGLSEGHPGHVDRWARYIEDGLELLGRLEQRVPGVPCFVFGHSMGSLICLELAMRSDTRGRVRGWIVSGAGIEPTGVAKPHLVAIARLLSGVLPRFRLDLGIEGPDLSHDRAVVERYGNDPLIRRRATVRWGAEALSSIDRIKAEPARVDGPILILHGGDDPLSRAEGSRWLAERVGGDPTLRIYEGCLHEPHNDPEYASAADDIADWIEAHA